MPSPLSAAAPWPVSQDIPALADRALSHADGRRSCPRAELRSLADALLQIHPAARAAERLPGLVPALAAWLLQLRGAVADSEDLLDRLLHRRPSISSCLALSRPARKLGKLVDRLDRIHGDFEYLSQELEGTGCGVRSPSRVTGSVLAERRVVGRDRECSEVVGRLVGRSDEQCCSVAPVVAIVGHGGVGKTTVAQCVYNDARIEGHFDLRAWVCVWDRSDEAELTGEILQSIGGADRLKDGGLSDFGRLQVELGELIMSKRFLLVLDDVWNDEEKPEVENRGMWKKVLTPFWFAASGSKILLTTRMKLVAEILNANHMIFLDGLGSSDCWHLFREVTLGEESMDAPRELREIGKVIAAKVKGLPLAAKAVGGMLRNTRSTQRWRTVLDTEICDHIVISSLQLSYEQLPGHLQRCFAYCSIFPRSWRFDRDKLVKIWVAQSFIQPSSKTGKGMEELGQEYFNDLLSRSFFQTLKKDHKTHYFLDSLMHDLAQYFSAHDCIRIEVAMPSVIPPTVRHISVRADYLPLLKNKCRLEKLRTLLVLRSSSFTLNYFPSNILAELKNLRVLDLSKSDIIDLPETIGQLVHLRHISLCSNTKRFPKCIYRLT